MLYVHGARFGVRVPGGVRAAEPSLLKWWHYDAVQRYPNTSHVPRVARTWGDGQVSISLTEVVRGHLAAGSNVLERAKQLQGKWKSHSETVYTRNNLKDARHIFSLQRPASIG